MAMIERQLPFYHRYAYINHCLGAINIVTSSHYTILGQDRVATPSLTHSITHPPTTSSLTENGGCMVPKLSQQKLAIAQKGSFPPKIYPENVYFFVYIFIYIYYLILIMMLINENLDSWFLKGLYSSLPFWHEYCRMCCWRAWCAVKEGCEQLKKIISSHPGPTCPFLK